ncbi:MAG: hypothetical protein IKZ07_06290 [Akkermansia sp.]|nr:hypothetical protein [Akkermansia sp.]
MDDKVSQALSILDKFIHLYKVDDEWIDTHAEFYSSPETLMLTNLRSRRMNAFYLSYEDLCNAADAALDKAMDYLNDEHRKHKSGRDTVSVKRVGTVCYKVLTIFGAERYSPKRLFQYALAHYLAMKKKHWIKNGGESPKKLKYGQVGWEIAEVLHPRARVGGKIDTQTRKMERALEAAKGVSDTKLIEKITYILKEIERLEKCENGDQWSEKFLILMESFMKNMHLGKISHSKQKLLIDSGHPDYPAAITDLDQIKALLIDASEKVQQELKSFRGLKIVPEITVVLPTLKKVSFRPVER